MGEPTYSVSTWDHETERWEGEYAGLSKWGLRGVIRELRSYGYSHVSVLIECDDIARWLGGRDR